MSSPRRTRTGPSKRPRRRRPSRSSVPNNVRSAAEGDEREAPRIDAAADGDQLDALGHVRVDDAVDAFGSGDAIHAEPLRDRVDGARGGGGVEPDAPAEEVLGIEEA